MLDMWVCLSTCIIGALLVLVLSGVVCHMRIRTSCLSNDIGFHNRVTQLRREAENDERSVYLPPVSQTEKCKTPPGVPLLGHSLTLRAWPSWTWWWFRSGGPRGDQLLLRALLRWSEQYDGAFQLRNGWLGRLLLGDPRVVVVLSDPPAVHALLALGEDAAVKSGRYYGSLDQASTASYSTRHDSARLGNRNSDPCAGNAVLHPNAVPSSATATSSAQWRLLRRSLLHAFSDSELQLDFEIAKAKALSLANFVVGLGPGAVVDVNDAALRLSLDVMGLSKLGYDFQAVESQGEVLMLRLLGEVAAEWAVRRRRLLGRWAPWISDGAAEGQTRCRILHHFIEQELWADIEARGPPPPEDVTLAAQLARLSSPPARGAPVLSADRTVSELAAQLLLAHGPTGHSIAWALGCLAARRGVQEKLVAELKKEGIFNDPLRLTYDMLSKLPYLDCVVREVLRLYPTMPCPATVRTLKKDVALHGRTLTAASDVWVDVFSMHRSPKWWRDPHHFKPERWTAVASAPTSVTDTTAAAAAAADTGVSTSRQLYDGLCTVEPDVDNEIQDPGEESAAAKPPPPPPPPPLQAESPAESPPPLAPLCSPEAFMPFSFGSRSCLGQKLAVAQIKAALAMLLCFLVFEPSGPGSAGGGSAGDAVGSAGESVSGSHGGEGGEVAPWGLGLFLRPEGGMQLLVAPRKKNS
ncbi:hypothetical protein VOLCADRAFT_90934 [Volvox carteri f. nagariensis]|uniref:Cytochrome P450 n=1 Tax=Volvox carteri f. nagariensis TaxID=3068 RepID=D8TVR9_VOLCA|nr:uncharacterized protein VOLCADRAFT_90934 [Volvox carteri f. nagariensis]EFJ48243.1 hypothetical protein VOLCADRAFT_90934 [Volvox carteri f. nagariensis]|eukprot:XP_002950497.1 hypothetical protein VOLCADRAFT_90934 [Volvox carteri f. nagariensis]